MNASLTPCTTLNRDSMSHSRGAALQRLYLEAKPFQSTYQLPSGNIHPMFSLSFFFFLLYSL